MWKRKGGGGGSCGKFQYESPLRVREGGEREQKRKKRGTQK